MNSQLVNSIKSGWDLTSQFGSRGTLARFASRDQKGILRAAYRFQWSFQILDFGHLDSQKKGSASPSILYLF